jgi:hypothetical protein
MAGTLVPTADTREANVTRGSDCAVRTCSIRDQPGRGNLAAPVRVIPHYGAEPARAQDAAAA